MFDESDLDDLILKSPIEINNKKKYLFLKTSFVAKSN